MTEASAIDAPKPAITKAVARGDLPSVRRIIVAAAAISRDQKIKTINCARKWTEHHPAYTSEENPTGSAEWFDVTPLTTAAMRGHDGIVEYLLEQGADPTLKGCPKDDIELPNDDDGPLVDLPGLHLNAFEAASKLTRKIRCCRRTQDLLVVVKPYWKRSVYSGSSSIRHKRTIFSNVSLNVEWILDAVKEVPPLKDYPLKAKDFDENMIDENYWSKKMIEKAEDAQKSSVGVANRDGQLHQKQEQLIEALEPGSVRQRRCFSCNELKPEHSYSKNQRRKGVEARCISCVATRGALDLSTVCPVCKAPKINDKDVICRSCSTVMANAPKKPPGMNKQVG